MRAIPANPLYGLKKYGPDGWWFHSDYVRAFLLHDCLALVELIWFSALTTGLPWTNFSSCKPPGWLTKMCYLWLMELVDLLVALSRSRCLAINTSHLSWIMGRMQRSLAVGKQL
jgi:hypothetical protein